MQKIPYVCPINGDKLLLKENKYVSSSKKSYPIKNKIPRFFEEEYSGSFGFQWNTFDKVQLDSYSFSSLSNDRFWASTNWDPKDLDEDNVLEVGSGAGRFTEVFLKSSNANLYTLDSSLAVEANFNNNSQYLTRLFISQASIYRMPFKDNSFDKLFCFGVLQHTPSFAKSIKKLVSKVKTGGEIVVDFYPYKGFYTLLSSKYILRPITKMLNKKLLLSLIEIYIDLAIKLFDFLVRLNLAFLTRFIPITDLRGFPKNISLAERRKWAVLDTFDAYSPQFDNPQKINNVKNMFYKNNCKVTFAGIVKYKGGSSTVVRAIKN